MFRVYACITSQHDLRLVVIAGIVCLLACYTAMSLLDRARATRARQRLQWLCGAAFVAGSGIWTTHFVAMLAFQKSLPAGYDIGLTLLSVAIATGVTGIGYYFAMKGETGAIAGGAIAGLAISAMHFVGMAAWHAPADVIWNRDFVIAAIAIGVVFGAAALAVDAAPSSRWRNRFTSAQLLALAILGMHFTAMAAVTLVPDPRVEMPNQIMAPEWMAVVIAAVTILIIALGMTGSIVDQHLADRSVREAQKLRDHVAELEATRAELEETTANLTKALEAAAASSQAKSQFLATMSHELRTPLNAVIGFSDLIASEIYGPLGDGRYREYAKTVCDSGAHLLGLINDVLDISKLDAGGLELDDEEVVLTGLVDDALRMVAHQAETGEVRLEKTYESDLPQLRADQRRVRQVVLNLLSNAVKFTPRGGCIIVGVLLRGGELTVQVADTGIGIAAEDIPRALERFGQIDDSLGRKYEGTGLGLPLSKALMELHGGTLLLESTLGAGTTVSVTFPAERTIHSRQAAA
jgi:signal transduction histidine kinase